MIAILDPELPETDDTLWAIAQPMVAQAARETSGAGSELVLVFDEQAQLLWSVIDAQVNFLSGQMVVTFDVQVEGGENSLLLTMSLLEMGGQLSATTSWSDGSILPQRTFHDIVATSSLVEFDPQLSPVVLNADLALIPQVAPLVCKCDKAGGGGCSQDDCDQIKTCPTPPPGGGTSSCAWTNCPPAG